MERPYIQFLADDLLARANESNNPDELLAILHEFQFRFSKRARQVHSLILNRWSKLNEESFKWPTTIASKGKAALAEKTVFQHPRGLLRYLGYRVGTTGLESESRKKILDWIYKNSLPLVISTVYMREWGQPNTGPRLRKMAESIAAFCRNAKRNNSSRLIVAISDWEEDLAYLKKAHYDGKYDFLWPSTTL